VFTHAFFKAALFLGAGSVIHALGGEQDMRKMGGLARKLPVTFVTMFAGWFAITGLPFGAGFWSKDLILEKTFAQGGPLLYGVALFTAGLTAVYMTRLMILTFWSRSRVDSEVAHHVHESPLSMAIPLVVLGLGALLAGFAWASMIPGMDWFAVQLKDVVGPAQHLLAHEHGELSVWLFAGIGVATSLTGIAVAFGLHRKGLFHEADLHPVRGFALRWTLAFDTVHSVVGIWPMLAISWTLDRIVNPLLLGLVRLFAYLVEGFGWVSQSLQRSRLRSHLILSTLGLLLVLFILMKDVL
jgi:NADH-quinone oxidoreductase subunit L